MRRILVILIIAAMVLAFPVAGAKDTDSSGNNVDNSQAAGAGSSNGTSSGTGNITTAADQSAGSESAQANKNESAGQGTGISENLTYTYQNQEEIKAQIRLLQNESANLSNTSTNSSLKNRNTVRLAVQALIAAGNLSGETGGLISDMAEELNNSVAMQYTAEERIQNRNAIAAFFFGGDSEAAEEIQDQVELNRIRLANISTLMDMCGDDCDEELKTMIMEELQILEEEQNRLQELSEAELEDKGLLGGLFS